MNDKNQEPKDKNQEPKDVNLGIQETLTELNQEEEWNLMTQEDWKELHKDHQTIDVSFKEKISEKLKEELLTRENCEMNEEMIPEEIQSKANQELKGEE